MYFDGFYTLKGEEAGVVCIHPKGDILVTSLESS
jgi:hypothetical protein